MKKALFILLFCSMSIHAQLHLDVGFVDVQDRMDGNVIAWQIGYDQFYGHYGFGANVRYTGINGDNYYTSELYAKYRLVDNLYRLDLGGGAGYNFDDLDIHPIVSVRNSLRLEEGTWLNLELANAFRNSKDWNGGGWRSETYIMFGIGVDVTRMGQRKLKKIKRFF